MLKHPWFRQRTFGWGWTPIRWQGWLVTLIFAIAIFRNFVRIDDDSRSVSDTLIRFFPQTIGIILILVLVCWLTEEKQTPPLPPK